MSKNVKTLFRGSVWDWLIENAQLEDTAASLDKTKFWIIPATSGDPELGELEKALVARFSATKVLSSKEIDQYHFRLVSEGEDRSLLICRTDGLPIQVKENLPFAFDTSSATFLQRMDFITTCKVPSPSVVPARLVIDAASSGTPLFEGDLEPYLPSVISWKISPSSSFYADDFGVTCIRVLINLSNTASPAHAFSNLIVQLALSIPAKDHDWLLDQLYFALTSRKLEYFFLGLYQLLEFFFPLKGITALKDKIGYKGTFLELRASCNEALGWNINHHTGARAAAQLASEAFANICLGRSLPTDASSEAVEKHKVDAIGKISDLRHLIAHQSFAARQTDEEGLSVKTEALLALLLEAFASYKRDC